ncbi:SoxR reducing system RseC family protein [Candidatus Nitrosoglobus terrae]|uniref:SoxR reducing system RseC family protein n=1 Tax=Candidatus Nitrosoglobus terrae TaxID=1630141 RepID=UPI0015538813|nr:SoxR reducing system RseC family protein [Candidatus Nitrosoglobus terrae]
MIVEKARVVATDATYAWVEKVQDIGCNFCVASNECGTREITRYLIKKPMIIKAFNPIGAEIGESVIVGISGKAFLLNAFLLYIMPLLIMFLGAGLGEILVQYFGSGENIVIWLSLGGLLGGVLGMRHIKLGQVLSLKLCILKRIVVQNKIIIDDYP